MVRISGRNRKVLIVAGSRPEVIKLAPVYLEMVSRNKSGVEFILTGQHGEFAANIAREFGINPNRGYEIQNKNLSLNELSSRIMETMSLCMVSEAPGMVITQGDTISTFAASFCSFLQDIPLAHVEAGLRTRDLAEPFPEEGLRAMISQIASLNFAPTDTAVSNLRSEGIREDKIHLVGNTIVDAMGIILPRASIQNEGAPYVLVTAHRRENWKLEIPRLLENVGRVLEERRGIEVVWVEHPNPTVAEMARSRLSGVVGARVIKPSSYKAFLALLSGARVVITDSGGVQEEAVSLGVPILVARNRTERMEGVELGRAMMIEEVGEKRVAQILSFLDDSRLSSLRGADNPYGDGNSSVRIASEIERFL